MIEVIINGTPQMIEAGTSLLTLSKLFQGLDEPYIVLAFVDNKLLELSHLIHKPCNIQFITTEDQDGARTYKRSCTLLLLKAIHDIEGRENVQKVCIQFSLSKGYYCEIEVGRKITQADLEKYRERMLALVHQALPIHKRMIPIDEAMQVFQENKMLDKLRLFRYRKVSHVNLYRIDDFEDYYYGYMVPDTSYLNLFELFLYDDGFVIQFPSSKEPLKVAQFEPQHKLFSVLKQSSQWGKMLEVDTIGALNDAIVHNEIQQLILVQEALQEKRIADIAEEIASQKDRKIILIAGPSSSGKTTFSHRLSVQLRAHGVKPHPIAVDNYFVNRELTPKDEFGNYDFECLESIDLNQFNDDMTRLLKGEKVEIPHFNFISGFREYKGNFKQLGEQDVLVIEGIHGLNDKLTYSLPKQNKFKIYISALTQLNIDEHNRIPTTDGRLLRRIVRDLKNRGADAEKTLSMWPSVNRGEERYIFPYQEEADVMFNSALIYELAVLKQYAEPMLFSIPKESLVYPEAKRLLKFLDYFLSVNNEMIPNNSILREFIGGNVISEWF